LDRKATCNPKLRKINVALLKKGGKAALREAKRIIYKSYACNVKAIYKKYK